MNDAWRQQYGSIRNEIAGLTGYRYTVLSISVGIVGAIMGLAFREESSPLKLWLPLAFEAVLIPSMLMSYHLSAHYYRLVALCSVLEAPPLFPLDRAYDEFNERKRRKAHPIARALGLAGATYRVPLVVAYGALAAAAVAFSVAVDLQPPRPAWWQWMPVGVGLGVGVLAKAWLAWRILGLDDRHAGDKQVWSDVLRSLDIDPRAPAR